jgi:hypothetical protein
MKPAMIHKTWKRQLILAEISVHMRTLSFCMSGIEHATDREDKKKLRKEHPSGWLYLT